MQGRRGDLIYIALEEVILFILLEAVMLGRRGVLFIFLTVYISYFIGSDAG